MRGRGGQGANSRLKAIDRGLNLIVVEHLVSSTNVWRLVPLATIVPTCVPADVKQTACSQTESSSLKR